MSGLRIVEVDPFDAEAFDAWHATYLAAEEAIDDGAASPLRLEELRVWLQTGGTRRWTGAWSGVLEGSVAVAGYLDTPLLDNRDRAQVAVHTAPGARRRGHGSAMARHLERVAAERGRSVLVAESAWPYRAGPEGAGQPGPAFARALGFELELGDVKRTLRLPVDGALLDRLADEAARRHAAYRLRSWSGPVPDDLVDGWARLSSTLMTEAPTGGLDLEPEHVDAAVVREHEEVVERQGRRMYNTVALDAAGEVVAYTDLATTVHEPGRAYQWGTLVRRRDRGHRLGLAVKVANLRLLQAERPDVHTLTTYNAEVNRHMVAINERLGFVPVARMGEFQKRLG